METASLQLPRDMIEAAIQREVSISISKALGDSAKILNEVVRQVLTSKVDRDGKPSSYGGLEFIKWAMEDSLKKAVKESINEEIGKYKDVIKKNITEQLAKKNSPLVKQLVDGMCTGVTQALENKWQITVSYQGKD